MEAWLILNAVSAGIALVGLFVVFAAEEDDKTMPARLFLASLILIGPLVILYHIFRIAFPRVNLKRPRKNNVA